MTMKPPSQSRIAAALNAVAVGGVFLIMGGLIWLMYHYTQPAPVDQARWTERERNLTELKAQNQDQLENYGWIDQGRGLVRLPVTRAVELTVQQWRNPAAARASLIARMEKALPTGPAVPATNAAAKGE